MTTHKHTVHSFELELSYLKKNILRMSGLVEHQLALAISLLQKYDLDLALKIIDDDKQVDQLERDIETHSIKLIALRAPMAQDLREIISSLKISSNLERIGDLSANISRRIKDAGPMPSSLTGSLTSLQNMGEQLQESFQKTIHALTTLDKDMVFYLWAKDENIDQAYNNIVYETIQLMALHKELVPFCTHLLLIAKNMERIGDHLTNIAEYIYYIITGDFVSLDARGSKPLS